MVFVSPKFRPRQNDAFSILSMAIDSSDEGGHWPPRGIVVQLTLSFNTQLVPEEASSSPAHESERWDAASFVGVQHFVDVGGGGW